MPHPRTLAERRVRRTEIRLNLIEKAEQAASHAGRSMKCGSEDDMYPGWRHADEPDGCKNDGSTCLCECHDPLSTL